MTDGELPLGALLVRPEERQRAIAVQAEAAREKFTEQTALLDGLGSRWLDINHRVTNSAAPEYCLVTSK
ncbi:hypothetical protein [Streptomyces sp. NPDC086777]|uniref:hypothetical protein n=1 Tax=Streptomyces sp. NPDC086777 TaxID=3154866 RepID=UPI00344ECE31